MSKLLIICFPWLFLLTGCIKEESDFYFTEKILLNNETSNELLLYFEMPNLISDTIYTKGIGSDYVSNTETVTAKSLYAAETKMPIHLISLYELYDLTDTMSYKLNIHYNSILSKQDSIFLSNNDLNSEIIKSEETQIKNHVIIYDETIKEIIMQKDYSLIEKFPRYYK